MLKHVLLYRFYPTALPAEIEAAVAALEELGTLVPEVREWSIGRDVGRNPARNHHVAQVSAFDDLDALDRYRAHPAHVRVRDMLSRISDWAIVDYET